MILINHASASVGKKRLSTSNKAMREVSRNKFVVKKSGMPDCVKLQKSQ